MIVVSLPVNVIFFFSTSNNSSAIDVIIYSSISPFSSVLLDIDHISSLHPAAHDANSVGAPTNDNSFADVCSSYA